MTSHSNTIRRIAKQICRYHHCSGLFDDLCQIGELVGYQLAQRSNAYVSKAVRHAMLKAVPNRQPEPLRDCDIPTCTYLELPIEFYISELRVPSMEQEIFTNHYINNISIEDIAKEYNMSNSSVYRLLSRLKKEFINVV